MKLQKAAEGFFVNKTFYRCLKMKGERLEYVVQEYEQQKILSRGGMSAVSYVGVGKSIGVGYVQEERSVSSSLEIIELWRTPQRNPRQILRIPIHPASAFLKCWASIPGIRLHNGITGHGMISRRYRSDAGVFEALNVDGCQGLPLQLRTTGNTLLLSFIFKRHLAEFI